MDLVTTYHAPSLDFRYLCFMHAVDLAARGVPIGTEVISIDEIALHTCPGCALLESAE